MQVQQRYNYKVLECSETEYKIIGKAVKQEMKQMIEYYEEEIAEAEACAMNSLHRGIWEHKIQTLKGEYATIMAEFSSILVNYQQLEELAMQGK